MKIAEAFNQAIRTKKLKAPVVLGRDHHDVSGTDSPYRETSNIYDGSMFCADMAVQNCIGDSFRGATWVSLHNGGGVGWGEVLTIFLRRDEVLNEHVMHLQLALSKSKHCG